MTISDTERPAAQCPIKLPTEPEIYEMYEERRPEGPILWDDGRGVWAVSSFELCEEVESDETRFARSDRFDVNDPATYELIKQMQGGARSLQLIVGEPHFKLHGGMSLALTRQVRANSAATKKLADEYLARLEGQVEFCSSFGELFPTAIITSVIGLPWVHDEEKLRLARQYTTDIGYAATNLDYTGEVYHRGITASAALSAMLRPDIEAMMVRDDRNMVAEIFRMGRELYDDWGLEDVLTQCRLLYFAGSNSSAHFLANIVYVLATNPQAWQRLDADRSLIPTYLEEILRVVPPVQARPRVAVVDTEVGGQKIATGDVLYLYNAAANREPERFHNPAFLDLDRKPRRHLAFNAGARACPGAPTARMEGRAVVEALLDRFERIELDPTKPAPVFVSELNAGYQPIHLIMTPRAGGDERPHAGAAMTHGSTTTPGETLAAAAAAAGCPFHQKGTEQ